MLRVQSLILVKEKSLGLLLHAIWLLALVICFTAKSMAASSEHVNIGSLMGDYMEKAMQGASFDESVVHIEGQDFGGDNKNVGSLFLPLGQEQLILAQQNVTTVSTVRGATRAGSRITSYFFSNPNTNNPLTANTNDFVTVLSVRFSRPPRAIWNTNSPPLSIEPTFSEEGVNPVFNSYGSFYGFRRRNLDDGEKFLRFFGRIACNLACSTTDLLRGPGSGDSVRNAVEYTARERLPATYTPNVNSDIVGSYTPTVEVSAYGSPTSIPANRVDIDFPTITSIPTPYSSIRIGGIPRPKDRIAVSNLAGDPVDLQNFTSSSIAQVAPRLNYTINYSIGGTGVLEGLWDFISTQTATTVGLARVNLSSTESAVFVNITRQYIEESVAIAPSMCRSVPCVLRRVAGFEERTQRQDASYSGSTLPALTGSVSAQFEGIIVYDTGTAAISTTNTVPISAVTIVDHTPLNTNNNNFIRSLFSLPLIRSIDAQIIQEPTDSSKPSFVQPNTTSPHVLIPISNVPAFSSGRDMDYTFYSSHDGILGINTVFTEANDFQTAGSDDHSYAIDLSPCIPEQIEYENGDIISGVSVVGDIATLNQLRVRKGYNTVTFFDLKPGEYSDCMLQLIPNAGVGTEVGFNLHIAPFVVNSFRRNIKRADVDTDSGSFAYIRGMWDTYFASDIPDQTLLDTLATLPPPRSTDPSGGDGPLITTQNLLSVYSPSIIAAGEGTAEQAGYLSQAAPTLRILVDSEGIQNSAPGGEHELLFEVGDQTTLNVVVPIQGQLSGNKPRDIPTRLGDFRAFVTADEVTNNTTDAQIVIQKNFSDLLGQDLLARQLVISTEVEIHIGQQSGATLGDGGSLVFRTVITTTIPLPLGEEIEVVYYTLTSEVVVVSTISSATESTILSSGTISVTTGTDSSIQIGQSMVVSVVTVGEITTTISTYVTTRVDVEDLQAVTGTQSVGISTMTVVTLADIVGTIDWHPTVAETYAEYIEDYEAAYLAGIIHFESFLFRSSVELSGYNYRPNVYELDNVTEGAEVEILMPLSLSLESGGDALIVKNHAQGQSIDVAYYREQGCPSQSFQTVMESAINQSTNQVISSLVNIDGRLVESIPLDSVPFQSAAGDVCAAARYSRNSDEYLFAEISTATEVIFSCPTLEFEYTGVEQSPFFGADGSTTTITFANSMDGMMDATVAIFGENSNIAETNAGTYNATIEALNGIPSLPASIQCRWAITPRDVQVTGLIAAASTTTYGVTEVNAPFVFGEEAFVGSSCQNGSTDTLSNCLSEMGAVTTDLLLDVGSDFTWTVRTLPTFNSVNYSLSIPENVLDASVGFQLPIPAIPILPTATTYGSTLEDITAAIQVTGFLAGQSVDVISDFVPTTDPQYVPPGVEGATQVGSQFVLSVTPSATNYSIPAASSTITVTAAPLTFEVQGVKDIDALFPTTLGLDNLSLGIAGYVASEGAYVVVSSSNLLVRSYSTSSNYPVVNSNASAIVIGGTAEFTLGDYNEFLFVLSSAPTIEVDSTSTAVTASDFAVIVARTQFGEDESLIIDDAVPTVLREDALGSDPRTNVDFGNSSCALLEGFGSDLPSSFMTQCPSSASPGSNYALQDASVDVYHVGITAQNEAFGYVVVVLADGGVRSAISVPESELVSAERPIEVNLTALISDNYAIPMTGKAAIQNYLNASSVFNPVDLAAATIVYGDELSVSQRQMRVNTNYCASAEDTSGSILDCSALQAQLSVSISSSTLLNNGLTRRIPSTYSAILPEGALAENNTYIISHLRPSTEEVFVYYEVELPEHIPPGASETIPAQIHRTGKAFVVVPRNVSAALVGNTLLYTGAELEVVTGTLVRTNTGGAGIFDDDDVRLELTGASSTAPINLTFSGSSENMNLAGLDAANYALSPVSIPATVVGSITEEVRVTVPIVHTYGTTNPGIDINNIVVVTDNTSLSNIAGLRTFIGEQVVIERSGGANFCNVGVGQTTDYSFSLTNPTFSGVFIRVTSSSLMVNQSPVSAIPRDVSLRYGQNLGNVINVKPFENYELTTNIDEACNFVVFGNTTPSDILRQQTVFGANNGDQPFIIASGYNSGEDMTCTPVSSTPLETSLNITTAEDNFTVVANTDTAELTIERLPVEVSASLDIPYGHDTASGFFITNGQVSVPAGPRTCSSDTLAKLTDAGTSSPRLDVTNMFGTSEGGLLASRCLGGDAVYFDAAAGIVISAASYTAQTLSGSSLDFSIASLTDLEVPNSINIGSLMLPTTSTLAGGTLRVIPRNLVVQPENIALSIGQSSATYTLNTTVLEGCMANGDTQSIVDVSGLVPEFPLSFPAAQNVLYSLTYDQASISALTASNYEFLRGAGIGSVGIGVRINVLLEGATK